MEVWRCNKAYEAAKQCIILDLDSALLHSTSMQDYNSMFDVNATLRENGIGNDVHIIPDWFKITRFRPHLQQFLDFAEFRFRTKVIWSAGGKANVELMRDAMESISCIRFDLVLTAMDTEWTLLQPCGKKDLMKVYQKLPGCTSRNTFIVDDNVSNSIQNPNNCITIPKFNPTLLTQFPFDIDLIILKEWFELKEVVSSKDVRHLNMGDVFVNAK